MTGIYIDDAHGTSIIGENGCGYALHYLECFPSTLILVSSLSKAFGAHGGCVSFHNSKAMEFAKKYSHSYIFSGPPSLPGIAACVESAQIHLSNEIYELQDKLWINVTLFDELIASKISSKEKHSPIRTILIGDEYLAINISGILREKGFLTTAAMYPTVPKNKSILRIAISSSHLEEQIKNLCYEINELIQ
ncbi:aminotransferase class I/II-fold pyridoxal phosphate-dependent enzyme [Photorhabdus heterorhabditis]|uniref:aminotransferase class I/II-fold pyridoxal phosphate-dependent enzyme n=1 Tax=Photorhabdus heterorhabditis TaxID=880156 RepID=UPI0006C8CD5D|nr:aminotransferase class I/II-fold pyridoxal phosphate-dependent enzyme [Photorhabdus heterorhabditis]MBS9443991.1 aminotransferase class I/II-fold pyridoxal phosphate-dependent enzyme [Photorhabdus heterorhabditis]